ncbi:hypothetical protein [Xylanimonas protaetiae]|uniref:AbiEi antitoxin C-terminal domain-containing protein n=1 Tax=Xylanimonas protaetiae TaxID=2509457 RepID=A0A4P6EZ01_9MICO|nr:hypothetical protein [Xylanimonas protaetiae]QAY68670.1 hypothetical protein ET471_00270 [Xylanimonas protaetiae]
MRLRRGAFLRADDADDAAPALGARATQARRLAIGRIHAVHRQTRAPHVVSHTSAALMWRLGLWTTPEQTHIRQVSNPGGTRARDVARHVGLPAERVEIDGVPVTTLAQTVLDCLLTLPPFEALVVADSALTQGLRPGEVSELLAAVTRPNGRARAALVLGLADPGAESVWETWVRYLALRAGLPRPRTQYPVQTHRGTYRADLGWPEHGVLAEFDGLVKYTDGSFGPQYRGRDALVEEKLREDAIAEALGARPIGFVAADARDVRAATARLLARFPSTLTATLRPDRRLLLPR